MGKKVISLNDVKNCVAEGKKEVVIYKNNILTPSVKDLALSGAIKIVESEETQSSSIEKCTFSKCQIKELIRSVAKGKNINISESNIEKVAELVSKQI